MTQRNDGRARETYGYCERTMEEAVAQWEESVPKEWRTVEQMLLELPKVVLEVASRRGTLSSE